MPVGLLGNGTSCLVANMENMAALEVGDIADFDVELPGCMIQSLYLGLLLTLTIQLPASMQLITFLSNSGSGSGSSSNNGSIRGSCSTIGTSSASTRGNASSGTACWTFLNPCWTAVPQLFL